MTVMCPGLRGGESHCWGKSDNIIWMQGSTPLVLQVLSMWEKHFSSLWSLRLPFKREGNDKHDTMKNFCRLKFKPSWNPLEMDSNVALILNLLFCNKEKETGSHEESFDTGTGSRYRPPWMSENSPRKAYVKPPWLTGFLVKWYAREWHS